MSKPKITLEDLFNLTGSVIYNPDSFSSSALVSTDTRTIKKGSIFVAIKGGKMDGHKFVEDAVKKGASAVVINKNKLKNFDNIDVTLVTVKDTTIAYGELGKIWRDKLKAKVVGITGSNGKTTTKEILSQLLEEKSTVAKTLSNNNNHLGVPLTILSAKGDKDVLVLELGTNHFGEIAYTAQIARPDYALITNIGESHLEFLHDLEGVAEEKLSLFKALSGTDAKLFLNTDDKILKKKLKEYKNAVTFGFEGNPQVKGTVKGINKEGKTTLGINFKGKEFEVGLPVHGLSNAKNFLAAAAVALEMGLKPAQIKSGAKKLKAVDKRLNVKTHDGLIIVDDTYNANPLSMKSAFEFINGFEDRKKVVVLGDMFELGSGALQAHKDLAKAVRKNKINEVYTIGEFMMSLSAELKNGKIVKEHFKDRSSLGKFLENNDFGKAVILVKGSRGMKMEEFVKILEGRK
ncbi:MAG: UDP-N-acetylmuramoyl-tripeptide--D-alanyl-D-alanine ligase [Bacteroidota bacterium]|jgi:UDP-N-acetylmuramoyl-tripeptide--D-alanyl-D-alanine ligase|nr:UDP-N-acetylmuramoyl-tripeptide--D-alanyl-D-alanine ligase [Ignavibacteria bacterium]MCU7498132.1 UDP-N-acetylmuramoyl-tripeptide--D-alanyl-D-alanine ligase [Ignavibacteria bacterium]MCU7511362.1 UDP-N-acetylmuramoyl-tripeptide--D-alanyl-D-alanine ligase [Ignavibacteria bacterium]MCU7519335.1 UDP-N-acetylmuramoyl-tripeptide--D-alanyl-D-alanine ligase [Ignavibacteria bacterium]MCU7523423.1 UDP-N-acetylmuramoyl-tripeptide--D-alanyl-D-alanine ligase [Ignavibacteria bacterium]